jgi:hypothetical protein
MSPDSSSFVFLSHSSYIPVMTGNSTHMHLANVGSIVTPHLSLLNVYLISKLALNLAFIGQLCNSGNYLVILSSSLYCMQDLQS